MITYSTHLENGHLESIKSVVPSSKGLGVVNTREAGVAVPERTRRPLAKHLGLTSIGTGGDGGVEAGRLVAVFNPVDHDLHVVLGVRTRLEGVGTAVSSAGDEVELVPVGHILQGLGVGGVGVHGLTDSLPVVDGRGGGDTGVGFTVVVDHLATGLLEGGEVDDGGLETVNVANHTDVHPVNQGVVGDVVKVLQVIDVEELHELGHVLATGGGDAQSPGVSGGVVLGVTIGQLSGDLPREVGTLAVRVVKTVVDGLGESNTLSGDAAVLGGLVASSAAFSTLAEAKAQGGVVLFSAVVGLANDGGEVEVQHAKVSTGDNTIGTAVERVTGFNGSVDDLVKFARGRVVVHGVFNSGREDMVDLLLSKAEGRGTGNDTVIFISPALDLTHTLTTTIGTALVVGVNLLVAGETVETTGQGLGDLGHFTKSLVGEHVSSIPVDRAVAVEDDFIIAVGEGVVAGVGGAGGSTVLETASSIAGQGETTTTGNVETILEVGRSGQGVLHDNLVTLPGVGVGNSDIAVVVGAGATHARAGIGDGVGSDGGGDQVDSQEGAVGRKGGLNIGNSAEIGQGTSLSSGCCQSSDNCASGLAHVEGH